MIDPNRNYVTCPDPQIPCVGCGYCCRKVYEDKCWIATNTAGMGDYPDGECPLLVMVDGVWRCKFFQENPGHPVTTAFVGTGCHEPLNRERAAMVQGA